jgi:hypothetical protein
MAWIGLSSVRHIVVASREAPILPEALRCSALSYVGRLSAEAMFELPVDFL